MTRIAPHNQALHTGESARLEPHAGTPAAARSAAARPAAPAESAQAGRTGQTQGSMKGMFRSRRLTKLPAELIDKVASHLTSRDIASLSQTNKTTHHDLQMRMDGHKATRVASQVSTLEDFQESIVQIGNTRSDLCAGPLRTLMSRINCLPETDRPTALNAFNNAADGLAGTPLRWRETILSYTSPQQAVMAGEHMQLCASCFGITSNDEINGLERLAMGRDSADSIKSDVASGASVQQIAKQHGIVTPAGIRQIEDMVIGSHSPLSARSAIEAGAMPREVAQRFGIDSPRHIAILMEFSVNSRHPDSAGGAVSRGASVQEVAARFGIEDPDLLWSLSGIVARGAEAA